MGKINPVINDGLEKMVEIGCLVGANSLLQEVKDIIISKVLTAKDTNEELTGAWLGDTSELYRQITDDREDALELSKMFVGGMGKHAESFELDYIEHNKAAGENT